MFHFVSEGKVIKLYRKSAANENIVSSYIN